EEEDQQQPLVGAKNEALGILKRILRQVLCIGIDAVMTMRRTPQMIHHVWCAWHRPRGEGREPTLLEDRLLSESSTGYNSLKSRSDSGGDGG
ncbi:unnamed protein product, partial [Ectocarpus fasciculatus]